MIASPERTPVTCHVRVTVDEVDRATVQQFAAELGAVEPDAHRLVVDLSAVSFMDAAGVNALLATLEATAAVGGELVLRNVRRPVWRILQLLDLDGLVDQG